MVINHLMQVDLLFLLYLALANARHDLLHHLVGGQGQQEFLQVVEGAGDILLALLQDVIDELLADFIIVQGLFNEVL